MMAKKITFYALFCSACLICGYIESLFSLSFIAPGIKLGLSNAVALLLVAKRDFKGALLVNVARILISALLFSNLFSLCFSLPAGIISLVASYLLYKTDKVSLIGISIAGGVIHNICQSVTAYLLLGAGVLYYLPFLILAGLISGAFIGTISLLTFKRIEKHLKF